MSLTVINLERSPERLAVFRSRHGFLSAFDRFSGIDGARLPLQRTELMQRGLISAELPYSDGAIGCALSHLALWDRAVQQARSITLCEDDAILNCGFEKHHAAVIAALPSDWDLVLWGWNMDSVLVFDMLPGVTPCLAKFDQACMRSGIDRFQQLPLSPQPMRLYRAFGTLCYSLSPAGAGKLRRACVPIRPLSIAVPGLAHPVSNFGIDVMMNSVYPEINAYACIPPIAISANDRATSLVQPH